MSRCSSMVLRGNGRVGLVGGGSPFFRPPTLLMAGAWPPPAPSVWKAWMVRPLKALMVSSTKPDSLSVSVWIITWMSNSSATERQQSIAAGVVPQSSCSLRDFRNQLRDAVHHLRAGQHMGAGFHQLCDGASVARTLQDEVA